MPKFEIFNTNGILNKFIFLNESRIININSISYIDSSEFVYPIYVVRIIMTDGYKHEIVCENREEAHDLIANIQHSILFENQSNIMQISPKTHYEMPIKNEEMEESNV